MNREYDYPDNRKEKLKINDFLVNYNENGHLKYIDQLQEVSDRSRLVIEIYLDDVYSHKGESAFVDAICANTSRFMQLFAEVAESLLPVSKVEDTFDILQTLFVDGLNEGNGQQSNFLPSIFKRRFDISFIPQAHHQLINLRDVKSSYIGRLLITNGMVSRVSDVKPAISVCTYTCDVCNSTSYQEITGHQFMPLSSCWSKICKDNKTKGKLQMQIRGSKFSKYQEVRIQELPDQVPIGCIPRCLTIRCLNENTRKCVPGDIIKVSGVLMVFRHEGFKAITTGLQTEMFLQATRIEREKLSFEELATQLSQRTLLTENFNVTEESRYEKISRSVAPEIYGHEDVKRALLLQLVGGVSRDLTDMKLRGDINVCLMGDPGLAKSQLLKYVASVAPRGVYTTGKGSSGVGLTAAVVKDNFSGELALEGGALVLADMGICCIDEFDKMNENDRTAIHEVMEQQTVSIAKAGISTTLNARTSVLAAANPIYGRYNFRKSMSENINLPNSLLSRFDLLFVMVDKIDTKNDIELSKHVLYVHRYLQRPGSTEDLLNQLEIKSFIAEARRIVPVVPKELASYIVEAYSTLRSQNGNKFSRTDQTVMTPRQLLSILRLSQALARLRLSSTVNFEDVDEALRLMEMSKASLKMESVTVGSMEDASSAIFNIIRESLLSSSSKTLQFSFVEAMVIKRGYTLEKFKACLREYQTLGIISLSEDQSRITMQT